MVSERVEKYGQGKITESTVKDIWRFRRYRHRDLYTEDGERVTVVYPGRPNCGQGADFIDAVIMYGEKLYRGDVEIHVRSGDWRSHGHHLDSTYNRVILHVVMRHNSRTGTVLQNGREVPVLALMNNVDALPARDVPVMPCTRVSGNSDELMITRLLDRTGDERFHEKAERFLAGIKAAGAGESLYRGMMGALGYSGNTPAFIELARVLPLAVLENVTRRNMDNREYLLYVESLLLGTAGFLSSKDSRLLYSAGLDNLTVERLERTWSASNRTETVPPGSWKLFRVRPCNSPVRRLIAMSCLLLRYRERGLLAGLIELVGGTPERQTCGTIIDGLTVTACSGTEDSKSALLGRNRAGDIAVNVLLPFYHAWSDDPVQADRALEIYRSFPRTSGNSLERHMKEQLGLGGGAVNSARRQQGLIHIYNNLCTRGKCDTCELGELKSGRYVQTQPIYLTGGETKETAGSYHCGVVRA